MEQIPLSKFHWGDGSIGEVFAVQAEEPES